MNLLTIGAFAALTRLSPKALRLYADLGLLSPAHVDPVTGYRFYAPAQQERARLVAWLRRLGLPLAQIRTICELEGAEAAQAVSEFWAQVETETATRRDLARFLISELSADRTDGTRTDRTTTSGTTTSGTPTAEATTGEKLIGGTSGGTRSGGHDVRLEIHYAVRSDIGLVRKGNQDAAYAGKHLIAVADGFGVGGDRAGLAAIDALRAVAIDHRVSAGDLLNILHDAVGRANHAIGELPEPPAVSGPPADPGTPADSEPPAVSEPPADSRPPAASEPPAAQVELPVGTTLTAMLWAGSRVALVHIGDSRAYLLRDGELFQITNDHTFVQTMVDDGRLSPAEAASHPQRALLLRALVGRAGPAADVRLHDARSGDRYLLCSDGLSAVVPPAEVGRVVGTVADPDQAVRELVELARTAGAPDNVSCVVADVTASTNAEC